MSDSKHTTAETMEEITEEVTTEETAEKPVQETADRKNRADNLNTITPQEFKKLSYWEKWKLRRQAGMFFFTATYTIYTLVAYVAIKMGYQIYVRDFQFKLDWWSFPLSLGVGLAYWFIHELIFAKKNI